MSSFVSAPVDEHILLIHAGSAACTSMASFAPRMPLAVTRLYIDAEGSMAIPEDSLFEVLECSQDANDAQAKAAAQQLMPRMQPWLAAGIPTVLLVVDIGSPVGRQAGLVISQMLRKQGRRFVTIGITPRSYQGLEAVGQAMEFRKQLKALSPGFLHIDGTRFGVLDSITPYLQHACHTIMDAVSVDNSIAMVNVDFDDICSALQGANSHMAYAVVQPSSPMMAAELVDGLTQGRLLSLSELRCATSMMVVIDAQRSLLKLSDSRDVMRAINAYSGQDTHVVFASVDREAESSAIGVTVMLSY